MGESRGLEAERRLCCAIGAVPRCVMRAAGLRRIPAVAHRAAASSHSRSPRAGERPGHGRNGEAAGRWAPPCGRRQAKRPALSKRTRGAQMKKARLWRACLGELQRTRGTRIRRFIRLPAVAGHTYPLINKARCRRAWFACCLFVAYCCLLVCLSLDCLLLVACCGLAAARKVRRREPRRHERIVAQHLPPKQSRHVAPRCTVIRRVFRVSLACARCAWRLPDVCLVCAWCLPGSAPRHAAS